MKVLGISAFYHDSAAALLVDGVPLAAAQEERFSRVKNEASYPRQAARFCLELGDIEPADLDAVVFYDKPLVKFERILNTFLNRAPRGQQMFRRAMPPWLREKLWIPRLLQKELPGAKEYLYSTHHLSHLASAFCPSPFEQAAILTVDGVGEWASCTWGVGNGSRMELKRELRFPHSLGLLYSAFTAYLGFRVNEGEYKLMGLAPYGTPRYVDLIYDKLILRHGDGSFSLNLAYFGFLDRLAMTNRRFDALFGGPSRGEDAEFEQRHLDIAASIQQVTEELMLDLVAEVHKQTGMKNLCLAGGVALNCVANGRILREGPFENLWIQPAAGDAGGALGAAYVGHLALGGERVMGGEGDMLHGALLGPQFGEEEIAAALSETGLTGVRLGNVELCEKTAIALAAGKVVGWFQGQMEFGPRALGSRSILADARNPQMQSILNRKIKFREGFRPFAPVVKAERCRDYFDLEAESPYMLLVSQVADNQKVKVAAEPEGLARLDLARSKIPAVTHVDGSARVQTVREASSPLLYRLLDAFEARTGCPVLVNTSFNVKDEPIVCTPQDAVQCYLKSGIDALAIGPYWLEKED